MKKYKLYFIIPPSIVLTLIIVLYISLAFYIGTQAERDTTTKSDVIMVLGAKSYINGKYNPCLQARVEHAVDLYKAHSATRIIMTGGYDIEDNVNEAEIMKKIAMEYGVRPQDILMEKKATSTFENFSFSHDIIIKNKMKSVIIVTEPFHVARSNLVAQKLRYSYSVSPATTSPCWSPNHYLTKYFLKEPLALVLYKIKNKL